MKNKKIIISLVIIVLVIIVGGVSVFAYSNANKKEEKDLTFVDIMKEYKAKGYVPFYITIEENNIEKGIKIGDRIDLYYSCNSFSDKMKNEPFANNLVFGNNYHEESFSIGLVAPQYIYEYIKYTGYNEKFYKKENCKFTVKKSKSKKDDEIKLNKETQKWLDERNQSVPDVE